MAKFLAFEKKFNGKILIVCESEGRQSVLSDLLINHKRNPNPVAHWQDFLSNRHSLCITNGELTEGLLTEDIAVITEVDEWAKAFCQDCYLLADDAPQSHYN
jgi:transcription-repair coupling factor (superfamily II helicase)